MNPMSKYYKKYSPDYTEIREKIKSYTKVINDKDFICKMKDKCIERREYMRTKQYKVIPEIVNTFENKKVQEIKTNIIEYIGSCNDDIYLLELINILNSRIKKLNIKYSYMGRDYEEECREEENFNIWN